MAVPARSSDADIVQAYRAHYAQTFARNGATSRGVDWGEWADVYVRYAKMLEVIAPGGPETPTLLDVGCGFGGLLDYIDDLGLKIDYRGVDIIPDMIVHARKKHPTAKFDLCDVFDLPDAPIADYVVCNGILTLKLEASILDMDRFARRLIRKMFALARRGVAFNMMTTHVNFMAPNLFYKNPAELFAFCSTELSRRIRLDQSYPLYEFTTYLYHDGDRPTEAAQTAK